MTHNTHMQSISQILPLLKSVESCRVGALAFSALAPWHLASAPRPTSCASRLTYTIKDTSIPTTPCTITSQSNDPLRFITLQKSPAFTKSGRVAQSISGCSASSSQAVNSSTNTTTTHLIETQPWGRWEPTFLMSCTRSRIAWSAFHHLHNSRSTAGASRSCDYSAKYVQLSLLR